MDDVNKAEFWNEAYLSETDRWSLRSVTPVFASISDPFAVQQSELFPLAPGKIIIPCSGRGDDAILFAGRGFDVTALDFAPDAMRVLKNRAETEGVTVTLVEADLFHPPEELTGIYDYVLEYTCVCAIEPRRIAEFVQAVHRMLKPGGKLVSLLFPVDGRPGGPPFAVDEKQFLSEMEPRFTLLYNDFHPASISPRRGKEKLIVWEKHVGVA